MSNDDNDKMETTQKKLNLREPYAEALEEAALEVFGSRYKQARVVEALLDQTKYRPDGVRITDDLRRTLGSPDMGLHSNEEEEDEAEDLDLSERFKRMKELDVDNAETTAEWLRERGPAKITRKQLVSIIEAETRYSQASAYNIARDALKELIETPLNGVDEWAQELSESLAAHTRKRAQTFAEFAGVEEEYVDTDVWYTDEEKAAEDYQQLVVRVRMSDVARNRRDAAFEELARRRPEYVEASFVEREREDL